MIASSPARSAAGTATDAPIETTWAATTATPALRAGVLVESVCTATEEAPGITSGPVVNDSSYVWLEPVIDGPVTVVLPDQPRPEIVVTNPTDRLFGTFDVTKHVTGATEGIVDPTEPYLMEFECTSLSGEQISGELEVPADGTRAVGPGQQIPTGSTCTLTEALAGMPGLVDDTFSWGPPTFTVDGQPVDSAGRQLSFMIPTPQEDEQEPNVEIVVTNPVRGQPAPGLEITKEVTSEPERNADGTVTLAYDVVVSNPGALSVDYDLTDEFLFADGVVVTDVSVENVRARRHPGQRELRRRHRSGDRQCDDRRGCQPPLPDHGHRRRQRGHHGRGGSTVSSTRARRAPASSTGRR